MKDALMLVGEFSKKVEFAVNRSQEINDFTCFDGLTSYVLGGTEMKQIIAYSTQSRQHRAEIAAAVRGCFSWFYDQSGIMKHALSKPYGYPGDFEMLEYVYDIKPHVNTQSEIGTIIDKWALGLGLPRAVRSRKNALCFCLVELMRVTEGSLDVLSIGSGGARELRELPAAMLERMNVTLVDLDLRALEFASAALKNKAPGMSITKIQAAFNRVELNDQHFDVIYSFGVFDYLVDRVIQNCFKQFAPLLKRGGTFVYSIKNSAQYQDWFYDIFTDWRFVSRNLEDGAQLIEGVGLNLRDIRRLESDVAAVYVCEKEH